VSVDDDLLRELGLAILEVRPFREMQRDQLAAGPSDAELSPRPDSTTGNAS